MSPATLGHVLVLALQLGDGPCGHMFDGAACHLDGGHSGPCVVFGEHDEPVGVFEPMAPTLRGQWL